METLSVCVPLEHPKLITKIIRQDAVSLQDSDFTDVLSIQMLINFTTQFVSNITFNLSQPTEETKIDLDFGSLYINLHLPGH